MSLRSGNNMETVDFSENSMCNYAIESHFSKESKCNCTTNCSKSYLVHLVSLKKNLFSTDSFNKHTICLSQTTRYVIQKVINLAWFPALQEPYFRRHNKSEKLVNRLNYRRFIAISSRKPRHYFRTIFLQN